VHRTSVSDYAAGNCVHCHEQHASIGGAEPDPTGGPDKYTLFYTKKPGDVGQTDNFCYKCHVDVSSYQSRGYIYNRSYSFRAGGWTDDTLNDILEAFSFTSPGSSHNLDDIGSFINGKWNYTADSNPCCACHNPHKAQGDPPNAPNNAKSDGTRGWPVSLPSGHDGAWHLWGNEPSEKMNDYTPNYQAPCRYPHNWTLNQCESGYEPTGSSTITDGSNLTDFVTLCRCCHKTQIGFVKSIDWSATGDKHGKRNADVDICVYYPYDSVPSCSAIGLGKVLSCLDCHEPHGAPNAVLIRKEVNGALLSGTIPPATLNPTDCSPPYTDHNIQIKYLCERCHDLFGVPPSSIHHGVTDAPYKDFPFCSDCHEEVGSTQLPINCNCCHYHGNTVSGRRTF
jgi:hypothetical protein